jgi:hypothetical protein
VKNLPKQLAAMTFVGCAMLMTNIQPASAFPGWKETILGYTNTTDNDNYYKAMKKIRVPTPPADRGALCRWRFNNANAKGSMVSLWSNSTKCYVSYWSWW